MSLINNFLAVLVDGRFVSDFDLARPCHLDQPRNSDVGASGPEVTGGALAVARATSAVGPE